mgnify:CR=1 FL=1
MHLALYRYAIAVILVLSACNSSGDRPSDPPPTAPPPITIIGATVITSPGVDPIDDTVVVVRGTVIETIGTRADTPVPKGGTIVDGRGYVLIAGYPLNEPTPSFGSLQPGAQADLVLLRGNTRTDSQDTDAVERVMQAGQWLDSP